MPLLRADEDVYTNHIHADDLAQICIASLNRAPSQRVYNAVDGERKGFAQYLVPTGQAFEKALEIAQRVAQNAPLTNYALMHALPRIAEQSADHGFFTEAMMAAIAQSAPEAKERVKAFLDGKAAKVRKS